MTTTRCVITQTSVVFITTFVTVTSCILFIVQPRVHWLYMSILHDLWSVQLRAMLYSPRYLILEPVCVTEYKKV
jgi:hypothetical protein